MFVLLGYIVLSLLVAGSRAFVAPSRVTAADLKNAVVGMRRRKTTLLDIVGDSTSSGSSAAASPESAPASSFPTELDSKQKDFVMGYLNKHHRSTLLEFATVFSEFGGRLAKRNVFSGGSYKLLDARLLDITLKEMTLEVSSKDRSSPEPQVEQAVISLDANPLHRSRSMSDKAIPLPLVPEPTSREQRRRHPVDELVRKLNRLCWMVESYHVTGKLIQMGIQIGGTGVGEVAENLYLNQVPHNRAVRQYFYDMAAEATVDAVNDCANGERSHRMKVTAVFPELNSEIDSYRLATLLEMAREVALRLAACNVRTRICVQGRMGSSGVTLAKLNGVVPMLRNMDWGDNTLVGNMINFGNIGKDHVQNEVKDEEGNVVTPQDDVFLLLSPQSLRGVDTSIIGPLQEMVEAAGPNRPVILFNPDLTDKVSSAGQQSVRGRKERMEFADSFETVFHFTNLYWKTSFSYILGSLTKLNPSHPWVAHQRRDFVNDGGEIYVPIASYEERPSGEIIKECMEL